MIYKSWISSWQVSNGKSEKHYSPEQKDSRYHCWHVTIMKFSLMSTQRNQFGIHLFQCLINIFVKFIHTAQGISIKENTYGYPTRMIQDRQQNITPTPSMGELWVAQVHCQQWVCSQWPLLAKHACAKAQLNTGQHRHTLLHMLESLCNRDKSLPGHVIKPYLAKFPHFLGQSVLPFYM